MDNEPNFWRSTGGIGRLVTALVGGFHPFYRTQGEPAWMAGASHGSCLERRSRTAMVDRTLFWACWAVMLATLEWVALLLVEQPQNQGKRNARCLDLPAVGG